MRKGRGHAPDRPERGNDGLDRIGRRAAVGLVIGGLASLAGVTITGAAAQNDAQPRAGTAPAVPAIQNAPTGPVAPGAALLKPPFDIARMPPRAATAAIAAPPPAPVVRLDQRSFYVEGTNSSEIDPAAMAAYRASVKPVQEFVRGVSSLSDAYVATRAPEQAKGASAWLVRWAQAGALTDASTEQGHAIMAWELAPISLAWLKVSAASGATSPERAAIAGWLRSLSGSVMAHLESDTERDRRNNNHAYWAAWGVMCAAVAVDDATAFGWSEALFARAMRQVEPDGALPLEMKRRSRALQYHNFALAPLVLMAETLAANRRSPPYDMEGAALRRLADFTLRGLLAPESLAMRAGAAQNLDFMNPNNLAWLEPYARVTQDQRAAALLARFRPMVSTRLGGDLSYYYAPPV